MMGLLAYYLFEETHLDGTTATMRRLEPSETRQFLKNIHELDPQQIDFAMQVTADNPNIPYDLHKATEDGRLIWTARLTLKVRYIHNPQ